VKEDKFVLIVTVVLLILVVFLTILIITFHIKTSKNYNRSYEYIHNVKLLNLKAIESKENLNGKLYAVFLSGTRGELSTDTYLKLFVINNDGTIRIIQLPANKVDIIETDLIEPSIYIKKVRKCIKPYKYYNLNKDDIFLEWKQSVIKINQEDMNTMATVLGIYAEAGQLIIYIPKDSINYKFKLN
jgi:hypothetical protein